VSKKALSFYFCVCVLAVLAAARLYERSLRTPAPKAGTIQENPQMEIEDEHVDELRYRVSTSRPANVAAVFRFSCKWPRKNKPSKRGRRSRPRKNTERMHLSTRQKAPVTLCLMSRRALVWMSGLEPNWLRDGNRGRESVVCKIEDMW